MCIEIAQNIVSILLVALMIFMWITSKALDEIADEIE
jgi:uncharacterized protein YoxC